MTEGNTVPGDASVIVCIDDSAETRLLLERMLSRSGYRVLSAASGAEGLALVEKSHPALVLLDLMMPDMDGFETCSRLQENPKTTGIPVIFLTMSESEEDRARAFSVGAVDFLVKPISKQPLLEKIHTSLERRSRWGGLPRRTGADKTRAPSRFREFKDYVAETTSLPPVLCNKIIGAPPSRWYAAFSDAGVPNRQVAKMMAEFLGLTYMPFLNPEDVRLGALPTSFCRGNLVVPVRVDAGELGFVVANPFDQGLLDTLAHAAAANAESRFLVTEPRNVELLFSTGWRVGTEKPALNQTEQDLLRLGKEVHVDLSESDAMTNPILHVSSIVLDTAISERASDIHIEPKQDSAVVRYRVDGDLADMLTLKPTVALQLVSRFKALAGMDVAERRKPQDGAFSAIIGGHTFKMRMATTSTPSGESLVIRVLEPDAKLRSLSELGVDERQVADLMELAGRNQGLLLVVGPTGSGKTTTLYSLLSQLDCRSRSLITVEDPVEYCIRFANQQQVNEKAGLTFDSLLKSAVRQDPDMLFMGEIRDANSAWTAVNFASTGHLTLSTLHTFNATSAIFRLQRLGLDRGTIADSVLCVVAQQLLKKLCPHCKSVAPVSEEERRLLAPHVSEVPATVARPVGCPRCNRTGYFGREGIYEVIRFDSEVAEMVRGGSAVSEIRAFLLRRGDLLMSQLALDKVRKHVLAPRDVYERVLSEETPLAQAREPETEPKPKPDANLGTVPPEPALGPAPCLLLAEDDEATRMLISRILERDGYRVVQTGDGADALLALGGQHFGLILSDIRMPSLDGFKLLEILNEKGLDTPVILLTGSTEAADEVRALRMGAADYIRKPVQNDLLLLKVKRALGRPAASRGIRAVRR